MYIPEVRPVSELSPATPEWLNEAERFRYPASMEVWYPRLLEVDVRTPETVFVELESDMIEEGTIHEMHWASFDTGELQTGVRSVGGPPAFLRSDMASNMYDMENGSRVSSLDADSVEKSANSVIDFNVQRASVPFSSLVVREWLDIKHWFTAWGGKRIGVEIRVFVSDGEVESWCFDWPPHIDADVEYWMSLYKRTKGCAERRVDEVLPKAERVAERFADVGSGEWSVDFVLTEDDGWYCTDMAPKELSQVETEPNPVQ